MGKTLQTIALLLSRKLEGPTLVVCPVVALFQWRDEIAKYTGMGEDEGLKVSIFHGASRIKSFEEFKEYDVIMTTYAVIEACFRKEKTGFTRKLKKVYEKSPLHAITWSRIVLYVFI